MQCLNTHGYRSALAAAAPHHEYLQAILADVEERLTAIHNASASPALQMEVPGHARAERLYHRRMARDVAKGVRQQSTFLSLIHSIQLLYGGASWRIFESDGKLSQPSGMHASSTNIEIPRLEMLDPEGMHLRRVAASVRIASLETSAAQDDNE
jgi:hypothetical protein